MSNETMIDEAVQEDGRVANLPYWSQVEKEGYIGARTQGVEFGNGIRGFLGIPDRGSPPYPAMILGHERYGLILDSLDQVAKLAAYGYVALAPDMASHYSGDVAAVNRGEASGAWNADLRGRRAL